jgi:hypothetical protein
MRDLKLKLRTVAKKLCVPNGIGKGLLFFKHDSVGLGKSEYDKQDHSQNDKANGDKLRNSKAVYFKRVVVAERFEKYSCRAVQNEHQGKCAARLADFESGHPAIAAITNVSPEKIEKAAEEKRIERVVYLRRMHRQAAIGAIGNGLFFCGRK